MANYDEQIKDIEDEIRSTQYNKATQHHIGLLKAKIANLRDKKDVRSGGKKGAGYGLRKSGDATVILVGFPSVGKSTILNKITNAESKIGAYAFTTLTVVPGVMNHNHAKIQVLDVPGLIKGASTGSGMGREIISVVRSSDLIVFITDPFSLKQIDVLRKELYNAGIRIDEVPPHVKIKRKEKGGLDLATTVKQTDLDKKTVESIMKEFGLNNASIVIRERITADQLIDVIQGNKVYVPSLIVVNKADTASEQQLKVVKKLYADSIVMSAEKDNPQKLKKAIFEKLKLMRIFLKEVGKKADMEVPLIVRRDSTVQDVSMRLHRDFLKKFKNAKVWGKSAKFPGQVFQGSHVLMDRDILQINLI